MDNSSATERRGEVNWVPVGLFLALTFGLTWLLDLLLWLTVGYGQNLGAGLLLQLQMLLPAFCAIALGMLVFKDSPLHQLRVNRERPRWFFYYFLAYTLVYACLGIATALAPDMMTPTTVGGLAQGLTLGGLLLLVALRVTSGREAFEQAGLAGGKTRYWLLFGAGFVSFYVLQTALNYAFRLGQPVDIPQLMAQLPLGEAQSMPPITFLAVTAVQAVLLAPFIALMFGFGEEYGWRGYLQGELIRLGKVRGILLVGIIWGVWHAPVILMGHNYPGYPLAGVFLMIGYTIGLGFALSYAVLKSGSVLLAAYLHVLNNQVFSFLVMMVYQPSNPVFSFGAGLYGILLLGLVALVILRDPLWREA